MTKSQLERVQEYKERKNIEVLHVSEDSKYRTVAVEYIYIGESRWQSKRAIFGAKGGCLRNN